MDEGPQIYLPFVHLKNLISLHVGTVFHKLSW